MPVNDQQIRLIRQHLTALRMHVETQLDALDQRLASLESAPQSHQNRTNWDGYLDEYARINNLGGPHVKQRRKHNRSPIAISKRAGEP